MTAGVEPTAVPAGDRDPAGQAGASPPGAAAGPAPVLWRPSPEDVRRSNFARYLAWLERERGLRFDGYRDAWKWSSTAIEDFWASLWDFFEIRAARPFDDVLPERRMPGARWFAGAELNYAEHAFRHAADDRPALLYRSEAGPPGEVGWAGLRGQVAALAGALRGLGVRQGDRVAAYLPNAPEAVVGLLASATIGAVWSSCSPDFGAEGAAARFRQVRPSVLLVTDGYVYGGKRIDRRAAAAALRSALPGLHATILVPHLDPAARLDGAIGWADVVPPAAAAPGAGSAVEPLAFEPVPFDHPLWILYSSGTTGPPKAIVHGHGGILLEHLKTLVLQNDMRPGDRLFWNTTTGWMMWNVLVGGLLAGCTPVLYDGSAGHPDLDALWRLADEARVARFGAGAAFFTACMRAGLRPGDRLALRSLRAIGSTGSPLPPAAFRWIRDAVKRDVWLTASSGGTEVCAAFLGGCPGLPVREGELQGPALGVRAAAFDERGRPVVGEEGELVVTEPMPSMPLRFWEDADGARYRESYFDAYPGVWRHGDRVRFTGSGGAVVLGRSDAALNPRGVRFGSSEIYAVVESLPEIADSIIVGVDEPDGGYHMPLFVVLAEGRTLDEPLRERVRARISEALTPRHLPDEIVQAPAVPRTPNGKRLEVPVRRLLLGEAPERAADPASLADPDALRFYTEYAAARAARSARAASRTTSS